MNASEPNANRILFGSQEKIFSVLPESVLANFNHPSSENALVWNSIYPLAQPALSLNSLMDKRPLWGTWSSPDTLEDRLMPFFWGFNVEGEPLGGLDVVLQDVDGPGPKTEVDLFLVGEKNLILVEAKHLSGLGRCSRYAQERCPEIGQDQEDPSHPCRYWEMEGAKFGNYLEFGARPQPGAGSPPCNRHYQLARTYLVGRSLAEMQSKILHIWMIVPQSRWPALELDWIDFAERVFDDDQWRRLRVVAWEEVRSLSTLK